MGVKEDFEEFNRKKAWSIIFQNLQRKSLYEAKDCSVKAAKTSLNINLNRYSDVSPYDHNRILLKEGETDYINASLVEGCALTPLSGAGDGVVKKDASPDLALPMEPSQYRRYILTQGPLETTACHFWQMVWEQNSLAIVMLNKVVEKEVTKCTQYWPNGEVNDSYLFKETGFKVTLLQQDEKRFFTVRRLLLEYLPTGASREVLHFHYTTWPDFGVPDSPVAFLHFLLAVRQSGAFDQNVGPPVVHCSAGIGRSGTFCLVDSALVQIEAEKNWNGVDVINLLMYMRKFRMGLIATVDQLRFSYVAIIEGGERLLQNRFSLEEFASGYNMLEEEEDMDKDNDDEEDSNQ